MAKINHHYIPQVYLKHWEDAEGLIWGYNLSDKTIFHRNKGSIFKEDYLYSITLRDWNLLPTEQKELFIEPLKPFNIYLNGKLLDSQEIIDNFTYWDDFEIRKSDGTHIKKSHKKGLLEQIYYIKHPLIEDKYSEQIETSWNETVSFFEDYRNQILSNSVPPLDLNNVKHNANELLSFILSLYTRNPFRMSQSINRVQEKQNIKVNEHDIRTLFETMQLLYLNGERYLFDIEKFDIHLIFTSENCFFITTDNPVFIEGIEIENADFKGLVWCPITPNILVSLSDHKQNDCLNIYHHIVAEETIRDFNSIILKNAVNCFLTSFEIDDMENMGFQFIYN